MRLHNDGAQPVYFDSLTLRHPQPTLYISQENHYYPFGLNLGGVAVNTLPAEALSKQQYNGGSTLEDDLLGVEAGNSATPYRRYDATLGRFLGVDPLADLYADQGPSVFAGNDPVNMQDPTGAYEVDGFGTVSLKGGRGQSSFGFAYSNPHTDGSSDDFGSPWSSSSTFDIANVYFDQRWAANELEKLIKHQQQSKMDGVADALNQAGVGESGDISFNIGDHIPGYPSDVQMVNDSNVGVYFKPETSKEANELAAGKSTIVAIDGFYAPSVRISEIMKVTDGTRVRVTQNQVELYFGSSINIGYHYLRGGGWKGSSWIAERNAYRPAITHPEWHVTFEKMPDDGWNALWSKRLMTR